MNRSCIDRLNRIMKYRIWDAVIICILILYPLRHCAEGLDLWDAGYNSANFVNPGPGHMSTVWYFSTILATRLGHIFTMLPYGRTYIGLNIYAGLIISAGALISYMFLTKKAGMNKWTAVLGMLIMMSMCYSPVTIVYTHLSNLLLIISIICIYTGLTEEKGIFLVLAGVILGLNVFVRFSNIVQTALIIAVWAYALFFRNGKNKGKYAFKECVSLTGRCMAGYFLALFIVLVMIHMIYGIDDYYRGVMGLFNMDSGAEYYTFSYMLKDMLVSYLKGVHRVLYIVITAAAIYVLSGPIKSSCSRILTGMVIAVATVFFMAFRGLLQMNFHHYAVVYNTAALFLDIVMAFAVVSVFSPASSGSEKLLSMLVLLQILLTSVGSNTGISVTMNSMYLTGPYLIWKLTGIAGMPAVKGKDRLKAPVYAAGLIISVFIVQSLLFGYIYVYQEGNNTGARDSYVTGNEVLKGVRMSSERAEILQDMTDYMTGNGLTGHDSVVYGFVPAISYYLNMPSVISCWPDLASYNPADMRNDLAQVFSEAEDGRREYPVVIMGNLLASSGIAENPEKTRLIYDYMNMYGYDMTHKNDIFEIWEKRN